MFDATLFIKEQFGSVDGVINTVSKTWGRAPEREAVRKWIARGKVASEWLPVLLYVLETTRGQPIKLAQYMKGDTEDVFS